MMIDSVPRVQETIEHASERMRALAQLDEALDLAQRACAERDEQRAEKMDAQKQHEWLIGKVVGQLFLAREEAESMRTERDQLRLERDSLIERLRGMVEKESKK